MNGANLLQGLLVADIVGMFALAVVYLRHRRLAWRATLGWVLVALIFPVFGPFLVIAAHPGEKRRRASIRRIYAEDSKNHMP